MRQQTRTHNLANEIDNIGATAGPVWPDPDHDAAGKMTTMPKPYELTESYSAVYDAWNRLIELIDDDTSDSVAAYRYDGEHRRIVGQTYDDGTLAETRYFHHSAQWQVIEERVDVGSNASEGDVDRQFLWGLDYVDELLVRFRDTTGNQDLDETIYALHDANYRITAAVTGGVVVERYLYSAYGPRTVLNDDWSLHADATFGSHEFHHGHQGLRHDPETGLVGNRNRIYIPPLGRFGQPDPLNQNEPGGGYHDGMSLYQYTGSNPIGRVDPSGLDFIAIASRGISITGYGH